MSQDLRKLFEEERKQKPRLKHGHEGRFLQKLEKELPKSRNSGAYVWKIAASILILIASGLYFFEFQQGELPAETTVVDKAGETTAEGQISLGDLSPDLKKIENYYMANISLELSQLQVSEANKDIVDGYMEQLAELNLEYQNLNVELNEMGPNDQTITALIQNLQLRLDLLQKLKSKLIEFKSSENEQVKASSV